MNCQERYGVEPYETPVTGKEVISELMNTLNRLVILQPHSDIAISLWVVHTYLIERAGEPQIMPKSPILSVFSPDKQCGKSTLKEVIAALCPRSEFLSDLSNAVFYRFMELRQPTMLIDEVDNLPIENKALTGILNAGFAPEGNVRRMAGKAFEEIKVFSTWGAKAMFGIGALLDTVGSRCIHIPLKRKAPGEKIYSFRQFKKDRPDHFEKLQQKILRYCIDNKEVISQMQPDLPRELSDREQDCWEPLIMIAKTMGNEIYEQSCLAAIALKPKDTNGANTGMLLLEDIYACFELVHKDKLGSQELIDMLIKDDTKPWLDYDRYRQHITPRQIAELLRPFDIRPRDLRIGEKVHKGYHREDFADAFNRYLDLSATTQQNVVVY